MSKINVLRHATCYLLLFHSQFISQERTSTIITILYFIIIPTLILQTILAFKNLFLMIVRHLSCLMLQKHWYRLSELIAVITVMPIWLQFCRFCAKMCLIKCYISSNIGERLHGLAGKSPRKRRYTLTKGSLQLRI